MKQLMMTLFLLVSYFSLAQGGEIRGTIYDQDNREELPFVLITLQVGDSVCYGAHSDFDGKYKISNIKPGAYELHIRFIGYQEIIERINVEAATNSVRDFTLLQDVPCVCIPDEIQYNIRLYPSEESETGAIRH